MVDSLVKTCKRKFSAHGSPDSVLPDDLAIHAVEMTSRTVILCCIMLLNYKCTLLPCLHSTKCRRQPYTVISHLLQLQISL